MALKCTMVSFISCLKSNAVLLLLLGGIVAGIILGVILRQYEPFIHAADQPKAVMLLKLPGELLIRAVEMATAPLLVSSLMSSVSNLDLKTSGMLGVRTLVFYISTTVLAAFEGMAWYFVFKPGFDFTQNVNATLKESEDQTYILVDMIR